MHSCTGCGLEHEDPVPPAEEIAATEARADVKVTEAAGEASAEVARIEADRDVKVAKIVAHTLDEETAAELAALRAEVEILRAAQAPPEPEPVPVVLNDPPAPPPDPEPAVPLPPPDETPEPKSKKAPGWWDGYR